jgi:hypothetical protein
MLVQSLRALSLSPGGPGSIWKYLDALVSSTGVSGRHVCGLQADVNFLMLRWSSGRVTSATDMKIALSQWSAEVTGEEINQKIAKVATTVFYCLAVNGGNVFHV